MLTQHNLTCFAAKVVSVLKAIPDRIFRILELPGAELWFTGSQKAKAFMSEPLIFQKFPFVQKIESGSYWWCACGRSKSQPFCDGSHKGTGLGPIKTDITEAKTVAWCGCKHSGTKPFCDGSHSRL